MERFERVLLYAVILALALVIALPYLREFLGETEAPAEPPIGNEEDQDPLASLDEKLATFLSNVAKMLEEREAQPDMAGAGLDDIAPRIADSVYALLQQRGTCLSAADERCKEATPVEATPVSVAANFTFLYENARLNHAQEIAADSVGVKLAFRHEQRLEMLERAFRPCQRDDAEVAFVVTGFSSTAEFQKETPAGERSTLTTSNELNLNTANLRAEVVADHLQAAGFQAETKPWKSFHALQRPYLDDSPPGDDQQALNRSVFIEVKNAGACDISRLAPPARR